MNPLTREEALTIWETVVLPNWPELEIEEILGVSMSAVFKVFNKAGARFVVRISGETEPPVPENVYQSFVKNCGAAKWFITPRKIGGFWVEFLELIEGQRAEKHLSEEHLETIVNGLKGVQKEVPLFSVPTWSLREALNVWEHRTANIWGEQKTGHVLKKQLSQIVVEVESLTSSQEFTVLHGDLNRTNILVGDSNQIHIIDWSTVRQGAFEWDLATLHVSFTNFTEDFILKIAPEVNVPLLRCYAALKTFGGLTWNVMQGTAERESVVEDFEYRLRQLDFL